MSEKPVSEVLGVLTGQVTVPDSTVSGNPEFPECENHIEIQHRDGLPPWCRECGWNRGRRATSPRQVKMVRRG